MRRTIRCLRGHAQLRRPRAVGPPPISWRIFWDTFCVFAAPFGYKISDSDIGYFAILQKMSGFADRIFGYFAILQQMSEFADRIVGYFAILL
jgi:hypothetical protein